MEDLPSRVARYARPVFYPSQDKLPCNSFKWGNSLTGVTFVLHQIRANCLWQRLCIIKTDNRKPQPWQVAKKVRPGMVARVVTRTIFLSHLNGLRHLPGGAHHHVNLVFTNVFRQLTKRKRVLESARR